MEEMLYLRRGLKILRRLFSSMHSISSSMTYPEGVPLHQFALASVEIEFAIDTLQVFEMFNSNQALARFD